MERTLISFIGRGFPPDRTKGQEGARSGYRVTEYSFADGSRHKTSLFGWVLWQYLHNTDVKPTTWLVCGTAASLWSALGDAVTDDNTWHLCEKWFVDIGDKSRSATVRQEDLDAVPPALAKGLGIPDLRLRLIDECATQQGQQRLMRLLIQELPSDSRVILDITHGYRHLFVLAFFLLAGLRWLRNVTIDGVYYGAYEMPGVPVIDLSICAQYAEVTTALATFELTGSHRALAPFFPQARADLDRVGFLEDPNQITQAKKTAGNARANLASHGHADPLLHEIGKQLSVALAWAGRESLAARMLERARFCLERRDYMRACILALEGAILHAVRQVENNYQPSQYNEDLRQKGREWLHQNLSTQDKDHLALLTGLRNAISHGSFPRLAAVQSAIQDEEKMATLLKELLDCIILPLFWTSG